MILERINELDDFICYNNSYKSVAEIFMRKAPFNDINFLHFLLRNTNLNCHQILEIL